MRRYESEAPVSSRDGIYYIEPGDVGKGFKTVYYGHDSEHISFYDILGRVQPGDIGKMMVFTNGVWKVENDEQFAARTARTRL